MPRASKPKVHDRLIKPPIEQLRDALHEVIKDMRPEELKDLLEEFKSDIEGNLESLDEEAEEED